MTMTKGERDQILQLVKKREKVMITHLIGEEICDVLDRRGPQLRPRNRR